VRVAQETVSCSARAHLDAEEERVADRAVVGRSNVAVVVVLPGSGRAGEVHRDDAVGRRGIGDWVHSHVRAASLGRRRAKACRPAFIHMLVFCDSY
jgi:hypothetical protein